MWLYTIPITCCVDGQAQNVTDESAAAGHHAGEYQALCGYVVSAASMIALVGRVGSDGRRALPD